MSKKQSPQTDTTVEIKAPNIRVAQFNIVGITPYVQLKFSEKAKNTIMEKMTGKKAKGSRARDARDFDDDFAQAQHISIEGWNGIPAASIRNGMISACRLVDYKMTLAKLSLFVNGDGFDNSEGVPLIKINGTPEKLISHVRNATGVVDLRVRAKFFPWSATVNISYDADQFGESAVANLLMRVGAQVGIGEGRPDGKTSYGQGFGLFRIAD